MIYRWILINERKLLLKAKIIQILSYKLLITQKCCTHLQT